MSKSAKQTQQAVQVQADLDDVVRLLKEIRAGGAVAKEQEQRIDHLIGKLQEAGREPPARKWDGGTIEAVAGLVKAGISLWIECFGD